jgi:hypothetical protein
VAYALGLPNQGKLHDVFHVSWLKKQIAKRVVPQIVLHLIDESHTLLQLEHIVAVHTTQLRHKNISQYKIKWKSLLETNSTWEFEEFN